MLSECGPEGRFTGVGVEIEACRQPQRDIVAMILSDGKGLCFTYLMLCICTIIQYIRVSSWCRCRQLHVHMSAVVYMAGEAAPVPFSGGSIVLDDH